MANVVEIVIRGLDQASAPFTKSIKSFKDFEKSLSGLVTVAGGAAVAVAGSLAALTAHAIQTADELGKMAQRSGLPVDQLSKLAHAAELADLSLGSLETALKFLSRSMVDAAGNAESEAGRAFTALGVAVKDAFGNIRSTQDVLLDVAEKFESYADGAEKSAMAMQLFGRSGIEVIPFLNQGKQGIQELTEEIDGVTLAEAKMAEEFNDNLTRLKNVMMDAVNTIAIALLPNLSELSAWIVKVQKDTGFFRGVAQATVDTVKTLAVGLFAIYTVFVILGKAIGTVAGILYDLVRNEFRAVLEILKIMWGSIRGVIEAWMGIGAAVGEVAGVMKSFVNGEFKDAFNQSRKIAVEIGESLRATAKAHVDFWSGVSGVVGDATVKSANQAKGAIDFLVNEAKADLQALEALTTRLFPVTEDDTGGEAELTRTKPHAPTLPDKLSAEKKKTLDLAEELSVRQQLEEDFNRGSVLSFMNLLNDQRALAEAELDGRKQAMTVYRDFWMESHRTMFSYVAEGTKTMASGLSNAITTTIFNLKSAGEAFKNLGLQIVQMFVQWIVNRGIAWAFEKVIASAAAAMLATQVAASSAAASAIAAAWSSAAAMVSLATFGSNAAPASAALISTAALAKGLAIGGAFHGGMDYVPAEQSYLLQRGERVIQPRQNEKLTDFLDRNEGGGSAGGDVFLDGEKVGKVLWRMSREGTVQISARAIV